MPRSRTMELGWTSPETEEEYRVTLSVTPGSPGGWEEAPTGPDLEIVSVREDRPGGVERPDLIDVVEAELSGRWGDEVAEEFEDSERDAYAAAMEDRADAARDERMFGGRA